MTETSYSVIRYIPDPGRGESLNIGILVWAGDDFALRIDEKAVERVIRENPRLERDALLYVEPMLREKLSSAASASPTQIKSLIRSQKGFPIELTEPRFTTVDAYDESALEGTLERLTSRVVTPKRRRGGSYHNPVEMLHGRLKPFIAEKKVERNHFFHETKTGVPRRADFYANSGANIALDVARLAITTPDEIRSRADAQAFKVYDVLQAADPVREYVVYCDFREDQDLGEPNHVARQVLEEIGATVVTELGDAVAALGAVENVR